MNKRPAYKFSEIAEFVKGVNYSSSDYDEEGVGIPFITIKCLLKGGGFDYSGIKHIKDRFTEGDKLKKGDLLFSITDLTRAGDIVGSPLLVPQRYNGSVASMDLIRVITRQNIVLSDYLFYLLMTHEIRRYFVNRSSGSTVLHLEVNSIPKLTFELPLIPIQRKIARILSTVDAVIKKTEAAIAKYQAIKAGMMRDLFTRGIDLATGKLRPSYEESPQLYKKTELGWVPKQWEVTSIEKSNVQIIDGDRGTNYPHENELLEHGYCLFLNASNVTSTGFVFLNKMFISKEKENLLGSGKLERKDIVITTRGTVGNIAFYSNDIPYDHMRINSGMLVLRNCEQEMTPEFLYQSFKNYLFDIDFKRVVSGSAQPQLPMKDLKSFRLLKPKEKEQFEIVNICKHFENLLMCEIDSLGKMKQLKQALMSDLLTGKVPVKYEEERMEVV